MVFILSTFICSTFAFLAYLKTWPPLDGDAPAYFSPAVEFSLGRSLVTQVWLPPLDDSIDGPGGRRYIYHGFAYSLLIGWLGKITGGGAPACVGWMHIFNVLAALMATWGVLVFCQGIGPLRSGVAFCTPLAFFSLCEGLAGRPEPAIFLWAGLGLFVVKKAPGLCHFLLPFLAVLIFFSSPAAGVLAFILLGVLRLMQKTEIRLSELAQALVGVMAATGVCFFAYPYPAVDWVMGVWRHSRINLGLPQGQGFFLTWLGRAQTPLLLITFIVPVCLALLCLARIVRNLSPIRRAMVCSLVLIFLLGLAKLAFFKTEASYNAVVWIPLAVAICIKNLQTSLPRIVLLGSLLLPVFGLARSGLILGNLFTEKSVSFHEVQAVIKSKVDEGIEVSSGLFLAVPDSRLVTFTGGQSKKGMPPLWRIEQQTYRGIASPPNLPGYQIVENRFGKGVNILGLPISRTPGGWEYVVYRRVD